jgi:hypothetical protein
VGGWLGWASGALLGTVRWADRWGTVAVGSCFRGCELLAAELGAVRSPPLDPAPGPPAAPTSTSAVDLRQQTLDAATRNIATLKREIERVKQTDAGRLRQEYQRLVQVRSAGALQGRQRVAEAECSAAIHWRMLLLPLEQGSAT